MEKKAILFALVVLALAWCAAQIKTVDSSGIQEKAKSANEGLEKIEKKAPEEFQGAIAQARGALAACGQRLNDLDVQVNRCASEAMSLNAELQKTKQALAEEKAAHSWWAELWAKWRLASTVGGVCAVVFFILGKWGGTIFRVILTLAGARFPTMPS